MISPHYCGKMLGNSLIEAFMPSAKLNQWHSELRNLPQIDLLLCPPKANLLATSLHPSVTFITLFVSLIISLLVSTLFALRSKLNA